VCSFCNMTFNKKEHLQRHERTHTLDRPYVCDFAGCGKTFARRDTLTRHTRLHKREDGDVADAAPAPATSSAAASLRVPKPARKRRARNGSATSTLAHDDSTENDDATSSSPDLDAGGAGEDDFELDHKLPSKRLQGMTIAHYREDDDDDDDDDDREEVKSELSEEGPQTRRATAAAAAGFAAPLLAATAAAAAEDSKYNSSNSSGSYYNWNKLAPTVKDTGYLPGSSPPPASSLGLDISLPATAGPASFEDNNLLSSRDRSSTITNKNINNNNHANELPGFVQATQHDFRIFRPIITNSSSSSSTNNNQPIIDQQSQSQQQQQQSPAQQPGWQQQSFLAGSPSSPNFTQLPQLDSSSQPLRQQAASVINAAAAPLSTTSSAAIRARASTSPATATAPINISPVGAYQSLPLPIPISQPPHMQQQQQNHHQRHHSMSMPNPGHRARQFSMDYSPMEGESSTLARSAYSGSPASVDSFLSLAYTGSSPLSVAGSLPSLPAQSTTGPWEEISSDYNMGGYSANPSGGGGDMPAAFKKANNAFTQPLTMGIGLHAWLSGAGTTGGSAAATGAPANTTNSGLGGTMWGRTGVDSDSKKHLYMLMRAAEAPTDEFLRWPSRDSSPAFGMSTSVPTGGKSSMSASIASTTGSGSDNKSRTSSSFIEFGEYNSTQAALFGDAAPSHSSGHRKGMVIPHSPIASLEQWLGRQSDITAVESMVF